MDIYLTTSEFQWYSKVAVFLWVIGFAISDSQKSEDEICSRLCRDISLSAAFILD